MKLRVGQRVLYESLLWRVGLVNSCRARLDPCGHPARPVNISAEADIELASARGAGSTPTTNKQRAVRKPKGQSPER